MRSCGKHRLWAAARPLLGLVILIVSSLSWDAQAAAQSTFQLLQIIGLPGVKGRFDHFAIDAKGQRLFVAALGNNTLEVIDLAAGQRLRSVSGMSKPTGVLYLPEANQVVVANGGDGTVKILSGVGYGVLHNLQGFDDADNLRLDPTTKFAWLGYGDGALAVIDVAATKALATIRLSKHPESFQLEGAGSRLFVNVPGASEVVVIDHERRAITARWPMKTCHANFPMGLDEANHRLLIGCREPPCLVVLDTGSGRMLAQVPISGDTDDLFYDARRKRVYLSCGEGFIDTIELSRDGDGYRKLTRLPTAPGARTSFFSPDFDRLYLAVPDRDQQRAEVRVYQPVQ